MQCYKCKDSLSADNVLCSICDGRFHFDCAGLAETSYRKMSADKKSAWRCTSCRNPSSGSDTGALVAAVMKELKAFRADFECLRQDFRDTSTDIKKINSKLSSLESRFESVNERLVVAEANIKSLATLHDKLKDADATIQELKSNNNARDQFSRLNNIEITGVAMSTGENLLKIVRDISAKIGFDLVESDINTIHRVRRYQSKVVRGVQPTREPAIIVRFTRQCRKDKLLAAVRVRRGLTTADIGLPGPAGNIFFNDHLTPINKQLLKRTRDLKSERNYKYLWVRDCKIMVRKNDTSPIFRISDESDLAKIK